MGKNIVLKKNKGSMSVLQVFLILMFVMFVALLLDIIIISCQHVYLSRMGNEIARTLAIQSGCQTSTPVNYPGGEDAYFTSSEIMEQVNDHFKSIHIEKYEVVVNDSQMTSRSTFKFDRGEPISVEVRAAFKWRFIRFIPGTGGDKLMKVKTTVFSEYRKI